MKPLLQAPVEENLSGGGGGERGSPHACSPQGK